MKDATKRVCEALATAGIEPEIVEFGESTRTAEQAAAAVGTEVGRIVKSLVFVAGDDPVMALVSGSNRLDTEKLRVATGQAIRRASADEVRDATGYAIGGVAPIGHARPLPVYVDADLTRYDTVYAAAGTPNTVFPIAPDVLVRVTGGTIVDIAEERSA